jgi:hypothetical protein
MSIPSVWSGVLDFFGTPPVIEPLPGQLSGDAGLLPVRQFDQRIGLTRAFAEALDDPRDPNLTGHSFLETVRSRAYDILTGHENQSDHGSLSHRVGDATPCADDLGERQPRPPLSDELRATRPTDGVRAPVHPTCARTAIPPICCGHIDRTTLRVRYVGVSVLSTL